MQIKCPHCEEMCETDFEPEIGQRILCPFCGEKFGYSPCDISTSNAPRSGMCGSRLDPPSHFEENSSSDILEPISVVHGNESHKADGNKNRLQKIKATPNSIIGKKRRVQKTFSSSKLLGNDVEPQKGASGINCIVLVVLTILKIIMILYAEIDAYSVKVEAERVGVRILENAARHGAEIAEIQKVVEIAWLVSFLIFVMSISRKQN